MLCACPRSQGSDFVATLGWRAQPRWGRGPVRIEGLAYADLVAPARSENAAREVRTGWNEDSFFDLSAVGIRFRVFLMAALQDIGAVIHRGPWQACQGLLLMACCGCVIHTEAGHPLDSNAKKGFSVQQGKGGWNPPYLDSAPQET